MAKRPSLAGRTDKSADDQITNEIADRDAAVADDQRDIDVLPAEGASDAAKAASEEGVAPHPELEDDPRAAIIASYNKDRDNKLVLEEDLEPELEVALETQTKEGEDTSQEEAAPDRKAAPRAEDDPLVKLKVDGKEIELPRSEVIAIAQKNMAADSRLSEANQLLDRTKQMVERITSRETGDTQTKGADPITARPLPAVTRQPTRDPAELLDLVDSLQAGTPEEAAERLAKLLDSVNAAPPDDQTRALATEAARAVALEGQAQGDIDRAIEVNREKFPAIAGLNDPDIGGIVVSRTMRGIVDGLKNVGYTDAELQGLNYQQLALGYAKVRRDPAFADGRKLRPLEDVVGEASQYVLDRYVTPLSASLETQPGQNQPARIAVSPERAARRVQAQPQPRPAPQRADMTRVGAKDTRRDSSDIVQQMARERGQASAG